ncbi:MAG: class I SAM-dependent methyltransferase [Deltaproteobacteria bacterium]|nr:class I SAM-dependent methyltransferase [Deltaproteobacteria bacterium]
MSENYYDKNAQELYKRYQSLDPDQIHCNWAHLIPMHGKALDVGCGSGRDAFFFACQGCEVTAVDPSPALLALAEDRYDAYDFRWLQDSLPHLSKVQALNEHFDIILLNAVWMHIEPKERITALQNLTELLSPKGKLIFNLRYGPSDPAQGLLPVDGDELRQQAKDLNLADIPLKYPVSEDLLERDGISWETLVFEKG